MAASRSDTYGSHTDTHRHTHTHTHGTMPGYIRGQSPAKFSDYTELSAQSARQSARGGGGGLGNSLYGSRQASPRAKSPRVYLAPDSEIRCAAVCTRVLQCVAVCCSVLQCAAVCWSVLQTTEPRAKPKWSDVSASKAADWVIFAHVNESRITHQCAIWMCHMDVWIRERNRTYSHDTFMWMSHVSLMNVS